MINEQAGDPMVKGILTDMEAGKIKYAIRIVRGLHIVMCSVASTYVWNTIYHSSLLAFCAYVLHVTHNINGQIT
jgi:hypothetical protein